MYDSVSFIKSFKEKYYKRRIVLSTVTLSSWKEML